MLSQEENQLIKIQTIFFFAGSLAGIFLQVFLFNLAGFVQVVLFDIVSLIFLLIFYIISVWTLKKYSSRTLIKIGLLTFSLGWILILLLQEKTINYLILVAVVFGIGQGNYWSGYNLSQYILTHQRKREYYFGKSNFLINIATSLGPLLGGLIIFLINKLTNNNLIGYYILFFIVLLLNFYNFLLCYQLPRHANIIFSFQQIINHQRSRNWKLVLKQQFFLGTYDVAFSTLSGILFFIIVKQEAVLGIIKTAMALLAGFASFVAGKLLIKHQRLFLLGALGTSLGILFFALFQHWWGIIILGILTGITSPFLNIPLSVAILNTIDEQQKDWQKKYYLFIERDAALGLARILNYLIILWLFSHFDKVAVAKNWLIVISFLPLILGMFLWKMKKSI